MKKATMIWFKQAEGRTDEIIEKSFEVPNVWDQVNAHIARCRSRMPEGMLGYYKCDFRVVYEDGFEYKGRYDMAKGDYTSLAEHMRQNSRFYAGLHCPAHMKRDTYDVYLAQIGPESKEKYSKFLENYEIGGL